MPRVHASASRALLLSVALVAALTAVAPLARAAECGEVVTIDTHGRTTTRYALSLPDAYAEPRIALVLLAGGGGHLDLDEAGCARKLQGNSLVRSIPLFRAAGLATALVDAPSDHTRGDGLAGFRVTPEHAADLGTVIADVRQRAAAAVWVVGTSRGTISAVNAAARLSSAQAPDGIVLTSALTVGTHGAKRAWVAQSVFDVPLEVIRVPVLVVGHAADRCLRSPASRMGEIVARTNGSREEVVTVTGGPGSAGPPSLQDCEGRSPHGFVEQEAEIVAGIVRFVRGERYRAP